MTDFDDARREAFHDYYENRPPIDDDRPSSDDLVEDRCQVCNGRLGYHEGPTCNRCMNEA